MVVAEDIALRTIEVGSRGKAEGHFEADEHEDEDDIGPNGANKHYEVE